MSVQARQRSLFVLLFALLATGCGTEPAKVKNSGTSPGQVKNTTALTKAPEIGDSLIDGPVVLNVTGWGHQLGDIVQLKANSAGLSKSDIVLYDWRNASGVSAGFGPKYSVGRVVGLPGDKLDLSKFSKYQGVDANQKDAIFDTFKSRGAKRWDGSLTLSENDYLIESDTQVLIVNQSSIDAIVVKRLGHDAEAASELMQRVY